MWFLFITLGKQPRETEMEEEKFFITERVINDPEFKGIHGILKHR